METQSEPGWKIGKVIRCKLEKQAFSKSDTLSQHPGARILGTGQRLCWSHLWLLGRDFFSFNNCKFPELGVRVSESLLLWKR